MKESVYEVVCSGWQNKSLLRYWPQVQYLVGTFPLPLRLINGSNLVAKRLEHTCMLAGKPGFMQCPSDNWNRDMLLNVLRQGNPGSMQDFCQKGQSKRE